MTLRIVVVGTGFGKRTVAPVYEALGHEVEIVSPHDAEGVKAAINKPCDLVSIHSPPFLHLEHVRLATASGRHVLCDKPFGCNATEAHEMLTLATNAGVLHFLDFEFRCHPAHVKAKEMLDRGDIGTPLHATWTTILSYGRQMPYRWLHDKDKGGGWIGAFGSHGVDFFRWMFGDVVAAGGQLRTDLEMRRDRDPSSGRMHRCTAEDAFTAWFRMKNGVTATLESGYSTGAAFPQQVRIIGSEGALQINDMQELLVIRPERESERHAYPSNDPDPHQPGITFWLTKVCEAVAQGRQITPDFNAGLACVKVLDTLRATTPA
jgi:predicted dehydrogenase